MFAPEAAPYLPMVITHVTAGGIAIVTGYIAVNLKKGERLHRAFGTAFVLAMLLMAGMATYLAINLLGVMPGQTANIAMGTLVAYLVGTAWVTARRKDGPIGWFEKFAFVVPLALSGLFLYWGVVAATSATGKFDGYPPYLYFVFAGIIGLFAVMDLKVILRGSLTGPQRIARHLSRMCFAFFVAAGSFFLGQQKVMPEWMHGAWYLYVLALAPLAFMIFWLIRVRFTKWYTADTIAPAPAEG